MVGVGVEVNVFVIVLVIVGVIVGVIVDVKLIVGVTVGVFVFVGVGVGVSEGHELSIQGPTKLAEAFRYNWYSLSLTHLFWGAPFCTFIKPDGFSKQSVYSNNPRLVEVNS